MDQRHDSLSSPDSSSTDKTKTPGEPVKPIAPPPADPSASFLARKARRRAEAEKRAENCEPPSDDQDGWFRGDTTSGAFRPLNYGRK